MQNEEAIFGKTKGSYELDGLNDVDGVLTELFDAILSSINDNDRLSILLDLRCNEQVGLSLISGGTELLSCMANPTDIPL